MTPDFPLTLSNVLWAVGAAAGIVAVTWGFAWTIFKNHIDNLQALKEAKDFKLPETLKALNDASERLKVNDIERKSFELLKTENPLLKADLKARSEELQHTAAKLAEAEAQLAELRSGTDDLWLKEHEAFQLIRPDVTLGFSGMLVDAVNITILNKPYRTEIGQSVSFEYRGQRYSVTLMEIDRKTSPYRARFSFAPSRT